MKTRFIFSTLLSLASLSTFAATSPFDSISEKLCKDPKFDYKNDTVSCTADNAVEVEDARIGAKLTKKELSNLKFSLYDAVTAGFVVDADSNTAYFYTRWLLNDEGKKVGVITMEGWYNSEMESSARFDLRYNLKGEMVFGSTTSIR